MQSLFERYPELEICRKEIEAVRAVFIRCYQRGGKLLLCGNGGSSADCDHIVGELMKGFLSERKLPAETVRKLEAGGLPDAGEFASHLQGSLPALSLSAQTAISTAFGNDVSPEYVFAQLLYGYAKPEDVLVCLSTGGNSKNVVNAARLAKAMGITAVALTGQKESLLSAVCDVTVRVPETETYKVQELHLPVYHALCRETEKFFFG